MISTNQAGRSGLRFHFALTAGFSRSLCAAQTGCRKQLVHLVILQRQAGCRSKAGFMLYFWGRGFISCM